MYSGKAVVFGQKCLYLLNIKERLYGARRKLTTSDLGYFEENKFYLAESLTEINRELFRACLSFKKELKFNYIWTYNSRIFLLENRESSVIHIKSKDDLDQLKTNGYIDK